MIRYLGVPLCLLALAGCADFREKAFARKVLTFEQDEVTYKVQGRYDPIAYAWFTQVWSPQRMLTADDKDLVMDLVSRRAGEQLCKGATLQAGEGRVFNPLAGDKVMFMESIGEWRVVARCA